MWIFRPGGKTPPYLSHYLLKNVAVGSEKYTFEDDGFDGFLIRMEVIKARSNQSGKYVELVFDKVRGLSPIRSCIRYAKEEGLIGGNKNAMYFINAKEKKFPLRTVEKFFMENKEMYKIMYDHIIPSLDTRLSSVSEAEMQFDDALMSYWCAVLLRMR